MTLAFRRRARIRWESPVSTADKWGNKITAESSESVGGDGGFMSADSSITCVCPKNGPKIPSGGPRRRCPNEVAFQTKPAIALDQIRAAVGAHVERAVVLADAAYRVNIEFRDGITELDLEYLVGVQSSMTLWEPGKQPLPAKPRGRIGRPPRLLQRSSDYQPSL